MGLGLGLGFRVRVRVRVGLGVNKLDVNYNIVTSPLYSTLAIVALGYSGPESMPIADHNKFIACSSTMGLKTR